MTIKLHIEAMLNMKSTVNRGSGRFFGGSIGSIKCVCSMYCL